MLDDELNNENNSKSQNNNKSGKKSSLNSSFRELKEKFVAKISDKDSIKEYFVQMFFPDDCKCIICNQEIPQNSKYGLCEECYNKLPFNNKHICIACGSPIENEACYCLECQNYPKHFDFARSSLIYENEVKRLIIDIKFYNNRWIEKYLAQMLFDTYTANKMDAQVIVPVPISSEREKEREYNQAVLLAKPLSRMLNIPLEENVIVKVKNNERQSALSGRKRRENVKGAYKLVDRHKVKDKKVLVVDDILTTGSTLSEVARQLKIAGASAVYGLVVASPRYVVPSENISESDFEILE